MLRLLAAAGRAKATIRQVQIRRAHPELPTVTTRVARPFVAHPLQLVKPQAAQSLVLPGH